MNAKLIVDGKEFEIEILNEELQKLIAAAKKTGYERVGVGETYFWTSANNVYDDVEYGEDIDEGRYNAAMYYSDIAVASNNARADTLMQQLRRFAVEHRKMELDWEDEEQEKWSIVYDYTTHRLDSWDIYNTKEIGVVYFDSRESATLAIKEFYDELIWYFTKYKDSL